MFARLGEIVAHRWGWVLLAWIGILVGIVSVSPTWSAVTKDGDFAYLPPEMTSVRGEKLLNRAFPNDRDKSQLVFVVARRTERLKAADFAVVDRLVDEFSPKPGDDGPILDVWHYDTPVIGEKLVSPDSRPGQAALTVVRLRSEFIAIANLPLMRRVHARLDAIRSAPDFPPGLELGVTGSAAIGTDMLFAADESIRNTELTTMVLVIVILVLVYRAPGLVVIPLATIMASVTVALGLLALLAQWSESLGWLNIVIFKDTRIFIIVILYGAGTDFCLFLIARYREELERGLSRPEALARALSGVSHALVGSAMTTVVGLGCMGFADFGRFSSSGPAIALCLIVALMASLTLTPALLRAAGGVAFWPRGVRPPMAASGSRAARSPALTRLWEWLSWGIVRRPGMILVVSLVLLAPWGWGGLSVPVTYDFLSELPSNRPSVRGTALLREHFLPGETGLVTVVAYRDRGGLDTREGENAISDLNRFLYDLTAPDAAGAEVRPVLDVRSLANPLGGDPRLFSFFSAAGRLKLAVLRNPEAKAAYLSQAPGYAGKVTRLDLVLRYDPFSREAIQTLDFLRNQLEALAADPESFWAGTAFDMTGTTAGIRDLEAVTTSDRTLIQRLVILAVLGVLLVLLRRPLVCLYLILSVLFSYYVTIGASEVFFAWLYGDTFRGLDWKVPIFLFVILIAVGQDYNIYLVTRVFEEQRRHGPVEGLRRAVVQTGGIITSCGVIMAGTFASMATGTLRAMMELGFSLSLGVLLDTLVVRTIVVPAFLALSQSSLAAQAAPAQSVRDIPAVKPPHAEPADTERAPADAPHRAASR